MIYLIDPLKGRVHVFDHFILFSSPTSKDLFQSSEIKNKDRLLITTNNQVEKKSKIL